MTTDHTTCPFCENDTDGWACERCGEPCCENCEVYLETHAATRIDPADGIGICPDCEGQIEADREAAEERAAENRAEARAADRAYYDDMRW